MEKLLKKFESFCQDNKEDKNKIKNLTKNFSECQIETLINNKEGLSLLFKNILIDSSDDNSSNSQSVWLARSNSFIDVYIQILLDIIKIENKAINLKFCIDNINLKKNLNLYYYFKKNNIKNKGLYNYLLYLPGFSFDNKKILQSAEENHLYITMELTENLNFLKKELKKSEKERSKIKNF